MTSNQNWETQMGKWMMKRGSQKLKSSKGEVPKWLSLSIGHHRETTGDRLSPSSFDSSLGPSGRVSKSLMFCHRPNYFQQAGSLPVSTCVLMESRAGERRNHCRGCCNNSCGTHKGVRVSAFTTNTSSNFRQMLFVSKHSILIWGLKTSPKHTLSHAGAIFKYLFTPTTHTHTHTHTHIHTHTHTHTHIKWKAGAGRPEQSNCRVGRM